MFRRSYPERDALSKPGERTARHRQNVLYTAVIVSSEYVGADA
ncbi:hypothetical protein [Agrobacterium tumefaciens]|nr:hypothetical protein [Agrobacterium tumefaciens]